MAGIDLSKISKRDRILLILAALFMAIILFNRFLYQSSKTRIKVLRQTVSAHKIDLQRIETKSGMGRMRIEEEVENLEEELRGLGEKLPEAESVSIVHEKLTKLARNSGVDFTKLKPGEGKKEEICEVIPLELDTNCRYLALFRFLSKLKDIPGLATVRAFNIESSQPPLLTVKMILDLHFLTPEQKPEENKEEEEG